MSPPKKVLNRTNPSAKFRLAKISWGVYSGDQDVYLSLIRFAGHIDERALWPVLQTTQIDFLQIYANEQISWSAQQTLWPQIWRISKLKHFFN